MRLLVRRTVAVTSGLLELAVVAIDGSKINGAATRDRTLDEAGVLALRACWRCGRAGAAGVLALRACTEQAIADLEAQNQPSDDGPPSLPPALREPQALRTRVLAVLDQRRAPDGPARVNLTDPDAVLLPSRHGWVPGYNGQLALTPVVADATGLTGQLITAAEITQDTHDRGQLLPLLTASR